jgi:ribosomal protein S9
MKKKCEDVEDCPMASHYECHRGFCVTHVTSGQCFIKVNGKLIQLLKPAFRRLMVYEPIFLLAANKFKELSMCVCVRGRGNTAKGMASRQAITKGIKLSIIKHIIIK